MSTPTEKPVDRISVCLSQSDFCRLVAGVLGDEVLRPEYSGRIEVLEIRTLIDDDREGWIVDAVFIPEDKE